jgi:nitroreductase
MHKPAETEYPIHDLLKARWSPRAFSSQAIEPEKLMSLFEAARWSPSGNNSQPWTFIVATLEDSEGHAKMVETLMRCNKKWAKHAPVLVLALVKPNKERPAMSRFAYYDVGQAIAHLSVQAGALGLHVHQMGGFDGEKARELFDIPADYEPMTISAIGYFGKVEHLEDDLRERELAPRSRKNLDEFVYSERWGQPLLQPELIER